jgi:hypothetical protein
MAPAQPFAGSPEEYWTVIERLRRQRQEECLGIRADYSIHSAFGSTILPTELFVEWVVKERTRAFRDGLNRGRLDFDASAAGACVSKTSQQGCDDYRREVALGTACADDPQVVGRVQTGQYCEREEDCAGSDNTCVYLDNACPGSACLARARSGESCADRRCVEGARCAVDAALALCVTAAPLTEGEVCQPFQCAEGLFCSNGRSCRRYVEALACQTNGDCPHLEVCLLESGATSGLCGPGRNAGEVCHRTSPTEDDCSFTTDCRPRGDGVAVCTDVWARSGEICRNTGANGGIVCIEGFCDIANAATQEGVCVPLLGPGQACTLGNCAAGLECEVNGCQPIGERCGSSSCSTAMYCAHGGEHDGQCRPLTPTGSACVRSSGECGFGAACVDNTCRPCP